jgi:hypothetical protein
MNEADIERVIAALVEGQDPDYKDDWERGFDAGRMRAAKMLTVLLTDRERDS